MDEFVERIVADNAHVRESYDTIGRLLESTVSDLADLEFVVAEQRSTIDALSCEVARLTDALARSEARFYGSKMRRTLRTAVDAFHLRGTVNSIRAAKSHGSSGER